jgi:hypothetical protein
MTDDKREPRGLDSLASLPVLGSNPVLTAIASDLIAIVFNALEAGASIDEIMTTESPEIRAAIDRAKTQLSEQGDGAALDLTELLLALLACALSDLAWSDIEISEEKPPPLPPDRVASVKREELLLVTDDDQAAKALQHLIAPHYDVTTIDCVTHDTVRLAASVQWAHIVVDVDTRNAIAFALRALDMGARVACFAREHVPRTLRYRASLLAYPFEDAERDYFAKRDG